MNASAHRAFTRAFALALVVWPASGGPAHSRAQDLPGPPVVASGAARAVGPAGVTASQLPLRFEENVGQTDEAVRFLARGPGMMLFLTDVSAVFALAERRSGARGDTEPGGLASSPEPVEGRVIRMRAVGASTAPVLAAGRELPGMANYFLGDDASAWRTGVRSFDSVRYEDLYDGVDLVYYGRDGALEYDFVVAPGADPSRIELVFDGAESVEVDEHGALVLRAGAVELRQAQPSIYQPAGAGREPVSGRYVLGDGATVRFELGDYDRALPLVIDPVVSFCTYLGGGSDDYALDGAVDGWGQTYVVGYTTSTNFPTVHAPWTYRAEEDVFVTVLGRAGMALLYSTYLGGAGDDQGYSLALDAQGAVYVTGSTGSPDFPTVNPIETDEGNPLDDVFVAKLAPTGASLVYSTYLGGDDDERGAGLAVDPAGSAYVAGWTGSTDYPTVTPYQVDPEPGDDAFVTKLDPNGTSLAYSTYLGGESQDRGVEVAVVDGEAIVTGWTSSAEFPVVNPFQDEYGGPPSPDVFVTRFARSGTALRYSTYVGGFNFDSPYGLAVDAGGAAIVVGATAATNFPTRNAMYPELRGGHFDGFVVKLSPDGRSALFSTYLGGDGWDEAAGVAVAPDGRIYVTGYTESSDLPMLNAVQPELAGSEADGFVACLNPAGSAFVYSTYLGGSGSDGAGVVAVDGSGNAYVVGGTYSTDFPTVTPYQSANRGAYDCIVAKISNATANLAVGLTAGPEPVATGGQLAYTLTVGNLGPNTAGDVIAALGVPAGTTFVSATPSQGTFVQPPGPGIGYFYAGRIASGSQATLRLVVRVGAAAGATIENAAAAITTALDPAAANNSATVESHVVAVVPPEITSVESMSVAGKPYRIRIRGTNFQTGVVVYIGEDAEPWPKVKRKSDTMLILKKGSPLQARFPQGTAVAIHVVNPDGGSDTSMFAR